MDSEDVVCIQDKGEAAVTEADGSVAQESLMETPTSVMLLDEDVTPGSAREGGAVAHVHEEEEKQQALPEAKQDNSCNEVRTELPEDDHDEQESPVDHNETPQGEAFLEISEKNGLESAHKTATEETAQCAQESSHVGLDCSSLLTPPPPQLPTQDPPTISESFPQQQQHSDRHEREQQLEQENLRLKRELDEAKSTLAVAEYVKASLLELERQKLSLEEELATMQQLLGEAHDEVSVSRTGYEHQLAKAKAIISQLENENHELRIHLKLGHGGGGGGGGSGVSESSVIDREMILGGAAVLSDATKRFATRMKSNLLPTVGMSSSGDKGSNSSMHAAASSPAVLGSASSLEDGMRKAYEDTELLKSIVVPLEEQIGALKDKLRETDGLLRQHEDRESQTILAIEALANWLQGKASFKDASIEILEKCRSEELAKGKEMTEGDLYVALMATRYSLLVSELTAAQSEAKELFELLSKERFTIKGLKREAVIASSEIIRSQREHLAELARLQSVLTDEQKAELAKPQSPPLINAPSPIISSSPDSSPSRQSDDSAASSGGGLARIVSNVEWEDMQKELGKVRALLGIGAGDSLVGSDQYQALQSELLDLKKQKVQLTKAVEKLKEELKDEAIYRREVEEKWNEKAEHHRMETEELNKKLQELEGLLQQLRTSYSTMYEATRKDLQNLTADREKIVRELKRLQDETDVLMGKHSAKSQEMQNEVINLPETMEEMQLLLLKLREDLITAKVAKERTEEKLKSEANFLRTQLKGEEKAKKSLEQQFTSELERLRNCEKDLAAELRRRRGTEEKEEKQKQSHSALRQEMEALHGEKQRLDAKVHDMKSRLAILQQELDNSVAVQNDFVRLSQSLQMELEKIRQSEKEVRWQHEDDVDNCQNCKISLNVAKKKHWCRHCGRIFCVECLSKSVPSGPRQKASKVCDVCHTLLVQNSAPYFSTEVPHAH